MTEAETTKKLSALHAVLDEMGHVTVALSGGLDSMTLAFVAHRQLGDRAHMVHAVSPAVPPEATARVRAFADREGWRMRTIDAGEFADPDYLANPVNRCFFCKSNLYGTIAAQVKGVVVSGANLDDLADYRPGMDAAANHGVRHPYVEAGIGKATIRRIAGHFGLRDLAELPASPCLSSRIETDIPVTTEALGFVHEVETTIAQWLAEWGVPPLSVRCRIRKTGAALELDEKSLAAYAAEGAATLRARIDALAMANGYAAPLPATPYRMGSAFLKGAAE